MAKKVIAGLAILVIGWLAWWHFAREPLPLGYRGTAEHLRDVPGKRPTVDLPLGNNYIKKVHLSIDGRELKSNSEEFTLPRDRNVQIAGRLEFDLGKTGEFTAAYIGVGSESFNAQGVLVEGELRLNDGFNHTQGQPLIFNINKTWRVPDRAGEFVLIVYYFAGEMGELRTPGRQAIVCPIRIE